MGTCNDNGTRTIGKGFGVWEDSDLRYEPEGGARGKVVRVVLYGNMGQAALTYKKILLTWREG